MRDRFRRLPSPSMTVAFIALLAALGGTAVALPGTGTVNSGDIRNSTIRTQDIKNNSGVRTQDIRNSTIRGRDVRNNTLRGPDINEASLGIVPSATNANTATRAITADSANRADSLAGRIPFAVQQVGDGDKTIANVGPFRLFLRCDANDGGPNESASLVLVSSVEYPAFDDNNGPEDEPVPAGQEEVLATSSEPGPNIDAEGDLGDYAIANVAGPGGLALWVRSYAFGQGLYAADSCWASGVIETAQLR